MSHPTTKRRLLAALAAVALAGVLAVSPATDNTASATSRLGGIDIVQACKWQYPLSGPLVRVTAGNNVLTWRCVYNAYGVYGNWIGYKYLELNLTKYYCQKKWPGSWADYTNFWDVRSWGCYR